MGSSSPSIEVKLRSKPPRYQMAKKSGCQGSKCAKAFKNTKNSNLAMSKTNEKDARQEFPMMNNEKPEGGSRRVANCQRVGGSKAFEQLFRTCDMT